MKLSPAGSEIWSVGGLSSDSGPFSTAVGVAVDSAGNVYVVDVGNDNIHKFDSNGNFILKWGSLGFDDGQFRDPRDVAVDSSGNVYVVDGGRTQKFDSSGNFILKWETGGSGVAVDSSGNVYVAYAGYRIQKFDSSGKFLLEWGAGARDVAVDSSGSVYVADENNDRIQKFDSNGNFILEWGSLCELRPGDDLFGCVDPDGDGPLKLGDGQFDVPRGVAADSAGNVYVADAFNDRVQKFDSSGNFILKWGTHGPNDGLLDHPEGVTVDSGGNLYVADLGNHRVQKFDSSGNFLLKWGTEGSGDGQFRSPRDVAVDSSGNVYVSDTGVFAFSSGNSRIQKFDSNGNFLLKWGTRGSGDGQFASEAGVAIDSGGNLYVADPGNHRVQKFDSSGNFLLKFGTRGTGDGQFEFPRDVAVDSAGNIYVVDFANDRVQKFDSSGNFLLKWGSPGSADGQFGGPRGVAVDSAGNVYVSDIRNNHSVQKFDSNGNFILRWGRRGSRTGQFNYPERIAVDTSGNVYVVEDENHRVQVFGPGAPKEPDPVVSPGFDYPLSVPWHLDVPFGIGWIDHRTDQLHLGNLGESYVVAEGTPVYTVADGTVALRHDDPNPGVSIGWGNALILEHQLLERSTIYSQYAYLKELLVTEGAEVTRGQQIGTVGQTGFAAGPTLHFEIKATPDLGIPFAGSPFYQDQYTHDGITYYRPWVFIEQHRALVPGGLAWVARTSGIGLRLRASPGLNESILEVMPEGNQVTVLDGPHFQDGFGWWQVQHGQQQGWAAGRYLAAARDGALPPDPPVALEQRMADGATLIPPGGTTHEDSVVLAGMGSDPNGEMVRLQVELRQAGEGTGFTGRPNLNGELVASSATATIFIGDLPDGDYIWQARAVDETGMASPWVSFSGGTAGFTIQSHPLPEALFNYEPHTPVDSQEVIFDASVAHDPANVIVTYLWDFNDGNTAQGKTVAHSFSEPGTYLVKLTIVDTLGFEDSFAIEIQVASGAFHRAVEQFVSKTEEDLDAVVHRARLSAEAGDYFMKSVDDLAFRIVYRLSLEMTAMALGTVLQGLDEVIEVPVGWKPVALVKELAFGEAGEISLEAGIDLADQVFSIEQWFMEKFGADKGFTDVNISLMETLVEVYKSDLRSLKEDALAQAANLTPEEEEAYLAELRSRRAGNIMVVTAYDAGARMPHVFAELKREDENSWTYIAGSTLYSVSMMIGAVTATKLSGGAAVALLPKGIGISELMRKAFFVTLASADKDVQMLQFSVAALNDGVVQTQRIYNNTSRALEIVRHREPISTPQGKIVSVNNIVEGRVEVWGFRNDVFARRAYSEVTIKNTGAHDATFELIAQYNNEFTTVSLWATTLPFGIGGRQYDIPVTMTSERIILGAGDQKTITLEYRNNEHRAVPRGVIILSLFSVPADDDRVHRDVYGLDVHTARFGTTIINQDGEVLPEEVASKLRVRDYPARSLVATGDGHDYYLTVEVTNPLDSPVEVEVQQQIPEGVEIVTVEGGAYDFDQRVVRWESALPPGGVGHLVVEFNVTSEEPANVTPALVSLYDQTNDQWLSFNSANGPITVDPVPPPGLCGDLNGDGLVDITDVIIATQITTELVAPDDEQLRLGDLNQDGAVNIFDTILTLQRIVGLVPQLECESP